MCGDCMAPPVGFPVHWDGGAYSDGLRSFLGGACLQVQRGRLTHISELGVGGSTKAEHGEQAGSRE